MTDRQLRPYQQRTVTTLYEASAIQAVLKMGAGKTVSALTAIAELLRDGHIRKALIIAPKRVAQMVWPAEIREWPHLQHLTYAVGVGPAKVRKAALEADVDIVVQTIDNIQWLCDELAKRKADDPLFDLLVFDELSRLKNPRSKRGKALRKLGPQFRIKWGLTGTPQPNGWEDQWGPLTLLSDGKLWGRSFDRWRRERFQMLDFNGFRWGLMDHWKARTVDDIARWSVTMRPEEMPQLPPCNIVPHLTELPEGVEETYADMAKELVARIRSGHVTAANLAVATGKLEQMLQGVVYTHDIIDDSGVAPERGSYELLHDAKLGLIEEIVAGCDENILLVYWFQSELTELKRLFGAGLPVLGSGTKDGVAAEHVRRWNRGELPLLALHPASAGHGLNLQHGGSRQLWTMPIWSAELWDQTLARTLRPGQTESVTIDVVRGDLPANVFNVDDQKVARVIDKLSAQEALERALRKL